MIAYSSHGSTGDVFSYVLHSAIWHVVGRWLYTLPLPVALLVGLVAVALVILRGQRRRRPVRGVR